MKSKFKWIIVVGLLCHQWTVQAQNKAKVDSLNYIRSLEMQIQGLHLARILALADSLPAEDAVRLLPLVDKQFPMLRITALSELKALRHNEAAYEKAFLLICQPMKDYYEMKLLQLWQDSYLEVLLKKY